jgi:hypothetical protein
MSPSGQIQLDKVWKMLRNCAPGHTKKLHDHAYQIDYNDQTMRRFPSGKKSNKRSEVQIHWVRKLAAALDIEDCAWKELPQLQRFRKSKERGSETKQG